MILMMSFFTYLLSGISNEEFVTQLQEWSNFKSKEPSSLRYYRKSKAQRSVSIITTYPSSCDKNRWKCQDASANYQIENIAASKCSPSIPFSSVQFLSQPTKVLLLYSFSFFFVAHFFLLLLLLLDFCLCCKTPYPTGPLPDPNLKRKLILSRFQKAKT